jgi:GH18 family chitinase
MNALFKWIVGLLGGACILGLAAGALSTFASTSAPEEADAVTPYVVEAAYPVYRQSDYPPKDIPLDYVNQIGHAFIMPGAHGALDVPGGFLMPQLIERVHAANKKIVVGVGGANSHDQFVSMVAAPTDRAAFVQNLTDFVIEHGYDGAVIDWEFPQSAADRQNLNALMAELRVRFDATGRDLQLNIAVSAGDWFGQWIDTDAITPLADYYLVMTYSYHGGWSSQSGHNTPLYPPSPGADISGSVDESIYYWAETRGVPRSQIILGLAFYGISFDSEDLYQPFTTFGQVGYNDIKPLIGDGYTRHWDSTCQVPYLTEDSGPTLWSYDDPQSIGLKCDYVIENDVGGVTIWDVTGDRINERQELLETVADKLMPQPSIFLSAAPDNVTIHAGQAATYTLSVTATGSVTGPVALTLHNQPAGVSAIFDPNPVHLPGTSLLTITNTTSLTPTTHVMTATGIHSPLSLSDSVSISLAVISTSPPSPGLLLSAAPDNVTIHAGQAATYTLSVTATDSVTGPVALTLHNPPADASAIFDPNPVDPPGTSLLTITKTTSLTPTTYVMTVTGIHSSLSLSDSVSISLTVISPRAYLPVIQKSR